MSASTMRRAHSVEMDTAFTDLPRAGSRLLTALYFAEGSDSSGVSPVSVLGFQSDRAAEGTLGSPSRTWW